MESLIAYISRYIKVSDNLRDALTSYFEDLTVKKNDTLLDIGSTCRHVFFLQSGTLRTFYYTDGKDVTSWFYRGQVILTSWSSYHFEKHSFESIQATENSRVLRISKSDLELLYSDFPEMERFGRLMMEEQVSHLEEFYKDFMFMNAETKYKMLLAIYPKIDQHVNINHIASFLGLTRETLSRLRNKMT